MAEIVELVSGGAGLASLALQLVETAQALRRVYHGYKHAPEILKGVAFEVETLSLAMREMEREGMICELANDSLLARCLTMCRAHVSRNRSFSSETGGYSATVCRLRSYAHSHRREGSQAAMSGFRDC